MIDMLISARAVPEHRRVECAGRRFGIGFSPVLEPTIYGWASRLASQYHGGYWAFFCLCNGGFYMAPERDEAFDVSAPNGYIGRLSADALGIAACMYAFSHTSFSDSGLLGEACAEHYHRLREFALQHREAGGIAAVTD
jgi:hypothetical protein